MTCGLVCRNAANIEKSRINRAATVFICVAGKYPHNMVDCPKRSGHYQFDGDCLVEFPNPDLHSDLEVYGCE